MDQQHLDALIRALQNNKGMERQVLSQYTGFVQTVFPFRSFAGRMRLEL